MSTVLTISSLHCDTVTSFVKVDCNMNAINVLLECRYLLSTSQVDFFGSSFYFLESIKFLNYYFLQSRILGRYLYFLQSNKVIYF